MHEHHDQYSQQAGWELFSKLCEAHVVNRYHVAAMRRSAMRAERGEGSAFADERRHLTNYFVALDRLREDGLWENRSTSSAYR